MNKQQSLFLNAAVIMLVCAACGDAKHQAEVPKTQEVSIRFSAMVGNQLFKCGNSYGLGTLNTPVTPADFRFYVSEVAFINAQGQKVPLALTQDSKWQYENVALLDFEDKSGTCANGTVEMRDRIFGTAPLGSYKGLQFTVGIPFKLNHDDATLASSPLNLTALWWNWRFGHKFLRIDLNTPSSTQNMPKQQEHKQKQVNHDQKGFPIHIGSTGCNAPEDKQKPSSCSNPNAAKVVFADFDVEKNVVVADLQALVATTNLATNRPDTPPGCMSEPTDQDCSKIMASLGLPFDGQKSPGQTFFKAK